MSHTVEGWFGGGDPYEALHIARQNPPPDPAPEIMKANVASYPPLGQVTVVTNRTLHFRAVLEVPLALAQEPWEVSLWQSTDNSEWSEVRLSVMTNVSIAGPLQDHPFLFRWIYFNGVLSVSNTCSFTVKFRSNETEAWRWIRDEVGMGDGTVVVRPEGAVASSLSTELADLIKDLNPVWDVQRRNSQAPGTRLWSLQKTLGAAEGENSCHEDLAIGIPWGGFSRWICIGRLWDPWIAPVHGKAHFDLNRDGILCSFLSRDGRSMALLAISGTNNVQSVFRADDAGHVLVKAQNDGEVSEKATILVAIGDDFEKATAAVMYHARDIVVNAKKESGELPQEIEALEEGSEVNPQWRQEWYDGLGYCTWNGLGQRLTDQKIYDALDKLAAANVKISNLIIDDNWQNIDYEGPGQFQFGWVDFEAEPNAFPKGLKGTVDTIRQKHPGLKHIAVWHALLGYWGGLSSTGNLAKKYSTVKVNRREEQRRNLPLGGPMTVVAEEDVMNFYNDFYTFLWRCGITGVKTDAQFMSDLWTSAPVRRSLINKYLDAWAIQSMRHFSSRAISCMSQTPDILFHSQLPKNRPPFLVRNSDDFFPDVVASHPWHVFVNAYNSLFTRFLNVLPDWDMFQTVHDYSAFHAAARCVSGGPIYITDAPGEHDLNLIGQMTATTIRDETVVLRNSVVGRTTAPYVGYHDDVLLKVGSYNGSALTGTSSLGIFNISARPLVELIPVSSFPGVLPSLEYVIRAHATRRITRPLSASDPHAMLTTSLGIRGYEILTAFPVMNLAGQQTEEVQVQVANLGLLHKMAGAAAIESTTADVTENGRAFLDIKLKALGNLGIYISSLPTLTIDDDFMATIQGSAVPPHTVSVSKDDEHILDVDVETAWDEMGLQSGWGNELQIKVYFTLR